MATQADINGVFQVLYEPVNENSIYSEVMEEEIFYTLPNAF